MPRTEVPLGERHKRDLISFMRFRDGIDYDKDHEFTPEALGNVTPCTLDVLEGIRQPGSWH